MRARFWLLPLFAMTTCGQASAAPIKIVASFSILGDMVRQVAGPDAEVTVLVGPDGDAHTFDPSPADAKALAGASLVVRNGLGFDDWLQRLSDSAGYVGPMLIASDRVHPRELEGAADPHAWQDLRNGIFYVRNIEQALAAADPAHADGYSGRAARTIRELTVLDGKVRAALAVYPEEKRKVITSHDAFGYFGAAYSITFLAPEGISTDAEPTAYDVARLVDQIRKSKIKAIFIESMADQRLIATIARETGMEPGGALYSDALSPPAGPAATYVAMFEWNVARLLDGLAKN